MLNHVDQLKEIIRNLEDMKQRCLHELNGLPDGELKYSRYANGIRYYRSLEGRNGQAKRESITRNKRLVALLARKEFLSLAIRTAEHDIAILKDAESQYSPCDHASLLVKMPPYKEKMPLESFCNPLVDLHELGLDASEQQRIKSHEEWGRRPYQPGDYMPEGRILQTSRKEYVRSKAELLIAEKLYEFGIPFRYEQELCIGGLTFHPDFTFEGAGGEEFYLEFCGMMDDENYVASHIRKRRMYEDAGIVPWKNIIYIYASGNEMSARKIVAVIENQIIPWL